MLPTLVNIADNPRSTELDFLIALAEALRPAKANTPEQAAENVVLLTQALRAQPSTAAALKGHILSVLASRKQINLYTEVGILSDGGFFTELFKRISYQILPPALDERFLLDCLDLVLPSRKDYIWIRKIPVETWRALAQAVVDAPHVLTEDEVAEAHRKIITELLQATNVLSYRISAQGLEKDLTRLYVDLKATESPFTVQNVELHDYLVDYMAFVDGGKAANECNDVKHVLVLLEQCEEVVLKIRKSILKMGTSVALTYRLVRLQQNLTRLRKLLDILENHRLARVAQLKQEDASALKELVLNQSVDFGIEAVREHNRKFKIGAYWRMNVNLLARTVTENASRTGEHYIAESRGEYAAMYRSAAGAGLIIGCMAMFKILAYYLHAPPLIEAFLYSMNYSLGFMLIHILHFTVATKQPAMTASRIAAGLQSSDGRSIDKESIVDLVTKVFRTQFVAVLGNLSLAFPAAYWLAYGYFQMTGSHFVTPDKATHMLHDINPFTSLSLFHAAIAGVCLFLAGLISGYYDNKALYTRMALRIAQTHWIRSLLGVDRARRFGDYIELTLGGLMGNFYFGILLGSMGTIGFIIGLPIDIRHITFAAANFAIALVGLDNNVSTYVIVISTLGVLLIGAVNLWVSFLLALFVALRSRQVEVRNSGAIFKALLVRFTTHPLEFLLPPKTTVDKPEANETEDADTSADKGTDKEGK